MSKFPTHGHTRMPGFFSRPDAPPAELRIARFRGRDEQAPRDWGTELRKQMEAIGMRQVSDTGQINWRPHSEYCEPMDAHPFDDVL